MIEITFRGRGGQGAFTASKIIGNACVKQDNSELVIYDVYDI